MSIAWRIESRVSQITCIITIVSLAITLIATVTIIVSTIVSRIACILTMIIVTLIPTIVWVCCVTRVASVVRIVLWTLTSFVDDLVFTTCFGHMMTHV